MKTARNQIPRFYFVVPCYKDEKVLPVSAPVLIKKIDDLINENKILPDSGIIFVNDGSPDGTWEVINDLHNKDDRVIAVDLSHNSGEQNALMAGMSVAVGIADCLITIDSDLQDDINAVDKMIDEYYSGSDIVFGVRSKRNSDPLINKITSSAFYKVMSLAKTGQVYEHSNFRLMSQKALSLLLEHKENDFFLPCLSSVLVLNTGLVYHERFKRVTGRSGYNIAKRLILGTGAVVSHSTFPMKLIGVANVASLVIFTAAVIYTILSGIRLGRIDVNFIAIDLIFLGSIILTAALRVIGQYTARLFKQVKNEPRYQIETIVY